MIIIIRDVLVPCFASLRTQNEFSGILLWINGHTLSWIFMNHLFCLNECPSVDVIPCFLQCVNNLHRSDSPKFVFDCLQCTSEISQDCFYCLPDISHRSEVRQSWNKPKSKWMSFWVGILDSREKKKKRPERGRRIDCWIEVHQQSRYTAFDLGTDSVFGEGDFIIMILILGNIPWRQLEKSLIKPVTVEIDARKVGPAIKTPSIRSCKKSLGALNASLNKCWSVEHAFFDFSPNLVHRSPGWEPSVLTSLNIQSGFMFRILPAVNIMSSQTRIRTNTYLK